MKAPAYFLVVSLLAGLGACSSQPRVASEQLPAYDALIADVNVVDVAAEKVLAHQYVGLQGQRIAFVGATAPPATAQARRIDGTGQYLIPGLWDMHVHYDWNYQDATALLLANGVVGVREMFGRPARVREIRRKIADGELNGPEIVTSGSIVDGPQPFWPGSDAVGDPATARKVVRRQVAEGVDFIKVYSGLPRAAYFAIATEARRQHVPFAGHVPKSISFYEAIAAGQRSTEHLYGLLEACVGDKAGAPPKKSYWSAERQQYLLNSFSRPKYDSLLRILAPSNTWICPTLVVLRSFAYLKDPGFRQDERVKYLPAYFQDGWNPADDPFTSKLPDGYYTAAKEVFALQKSLLGDMQKAGVKLLAGTDYPNPYCFPGFSLHNELQLLVEGGLTPAQALKTATVNPAAYLQKEADYGSIEPGQYASLLLLDANPLANVANTRKIAGVFLKGHYFAKPELEQLLVQAEKNAARTPVSGWFENNLKTQGLAKAKARLDSLVRQKPDAYDYSENVLVALGYKLLRGKQLKPALAIFELSTVLYPAAANTYDSYAEALAAAGQKALAIQNYQKAYALDSTNANAAAMLQKLRAAK